MANNIKMPTHRVDEVSSEVRAVRREASLWGGSKGKQALLYYDVAKNQSDNQTVALGKNKVPSVQVDSGVNLFYALNAKQSREEGYP